MIENQNNNEDGFELVQTKVPQHVKQLLDILAGQRGMSTYELLQLLIDGFITAAKADGPISPQVRMLLETLKTDTSWKGAFSFTGISGSTDVEQAILILRQRDQHGHPKHGFGLVMIEHPFCGGTTMTTCVDDIMERVIKVSMPGLHRRLDKVGARLCCNSQRETLTLLSEYMNDSLDKEEEQQEMPGYGTYHDFGKDVVYGQKHIRHPHRTPDSVANAKQQTIQFDDFDRDITQVDVQDWEGEHRQTDFENPLGDIRPFDQEP